MQVQQMQWEIVMSTDDNPEGERIEGPFTEYEEVFEAYKFWIGHYLHEITSFHIHGFNYSVNGKSRSIYLLPL